MIGYLGILSEDGKFVPLSEAYDYALKRCLNGTPKDQREFREMLVEWFYSGDWVKEETMSQGKIIASTIMKEEQLDIARLLVKAGYMVSIKNGKAVDGKETTFINYERED